MTRSGIVGALMVAMAIFALGSSCTKDDSPAIRTILELEDRRVVAADAWREQLDAPSAHVRRLAARGVGRLRDASLTALLTERLGRETDASVRHELIFALGQLSDVGAAETLERFAARGEPRERALAVEALGKLDGPGATPAVVRALDDGDAATRAAGALALVRKLGRRVSPAPVMSASDGAARLETLTSRLGDGSAIVREAAAYALSEIPLPGRGPALTGLLQDPSPVIRLFAVRGLARAARDGTATVPADAIEPLLRDPDPHVAAGSAAALGSLTAVSATPALIEAAGRSRDARDHHVRSAALAALGVIHASASAGGGTTALAAIDAALDDPAASVRRAALDARARIDPAGSTGLLTRWAASADPLDRAAAASAAAVLPNRASLPLLRLLSADPDPRPAATATRSLGALSLPTDDAREAVRAALARDDLAVRASALGSLSQIGESGDLSAIETAYAESRGAAGAEIRIEALRAHHALGGRASAPLLDRGMGDPSPAVAAVAAELIFELTAERPAPRTRESRESTVALEIGTDVLSDAPNPVVVLETERGEIVLELLREDAPRHVKSFLARARAGLHDGLTFHRVVPGFVIQGLDPRGDGWGSGGVFLRDEINPVPFTRGAVGMPNAGPDTAGCQIFVTHVPTPHLDGRYTVFGRVIAGMDVVDAIQAGDAVRRVAPR